MRHRTWPILVVAACALTGAALAQEPAALPVDPVAESEATEESPVAQPLELWFVELSSPPTADGTSLATVRAEKEAFRRAAARARLEYTERYAFDTLWNGLSIRLSSDQVAKLSRLEGVKAVWPVVEVTLAEDAAENPDLGTALAQTGANIAQTSLGLSGAGIRVAIMDTGVDYHHPDLGGCFGAGCRVETGYDFVGNAFGTTSGTPAPDNDPDDCNGHGTHVAGIVGANGSVKGVAPGVTFGAYRVFGCGGSTSADIMIAAMERALADDMHVLNMSIGSAFQTWHTYPTAAASDRAVNKGMVVVASIGNSGASGVYSAGAPGVGRKVIGVASFNNTHVAQSAFSATPDGALFGYNNATGAPPAPFSGSLPMAKTGTTTTTNDACAALPAGSLTGKAALIRRGTCTFYAKAMNAQNAGAAAVVLYNNAAGALNPTVAGTPPITIPVVAITQADGATLDGRIVAGPTTLTWTTQTVNTPSSSGNLISSFSSYGMTADLTLKPDIGAPGGNIRSTYPIELGSYANISGTSMSSPHVAGAVALFLQARPNTPSQVVGTILQNSADPKVWSLNPGLGFLDHTHRQGAGMLDIDDAILATTKIEPGKLSTGESEAGPATRSLVISNGSGSDVSYALGHVPALATGGPTNAPTFFNAPATVAFSQGGAPVSSVDVPAGGSASVEVTITANAALPDRSQYGGYLTFTTGGGEVYRVPYGGFKGDYQSIVAITPTTCPVALPAVGEKGSTLFCGVTTAVPFKLPAADQTYTLASGDVPYVVFHLDHQTRRVRIEATDAVSGKTWHRVGDFEYLSRNSNNGYFWVSWNGQTAAGNKVYTVPDGQYVLKMSVLKALGDDDNPAHWETWTSPVITIDRP